MKKIISAIVLALTVIFAFAINTSAEYENTIEFEYYTEDGFMDICEVDAEPGLARVPETIPKEVDEIYYDFVAWLGSDGKLYSKEQIELDFADGEPSIRYYLAVYEDEYTPCTEHIFGEYVSDGNGSCTEQGTKTAWCENGCGAKDIINDDNEPTGHEFAEEYSVVNAATLKADGLKAKCCIYGCGEYIDEQTIPAIKSVSLSKTQYIHDGKNKTPKVTVKDTEGNTLVKNVDYTIKVASSRKGIGKYSVKVTFIGDYSGSKSVYFYIKPGATSKLTATTDSNSVWLTWNKVSGAAGYTVYRYSPSKKAYVEAGTTTYTTLRVSKLYSDTKYTFKVVAYGKTSGGKVYYSDSYKSCEATTLVKFVKTAVTDKVTCTPTKDTITLKWNKVPGAVGYKLYIAVSGKWNEMGTVLDNTFTVDGLGAGCKYRFAIKAYGRVDGKTVWATKYAKVDTATLPSISGSKTMYVGGSKEFTAKSKTSVTWSTSDKNIATVSSSGKVTTKKTGTVTISAYFKYNSKTYKATYEVTVKKPTIKLNKTSASIAKGATLTLKATTTPADRTVTWKSSNTSVATVSSAGKVTAKKAGAATITASFSYGGYTYSKTCKITVTNATTAQANITKLVDHIKKYGYENSDGNKFIKITNDTGNYYTSYAIVYEAYEDRLHFICLDEHVSEGGFRSVCTMDLNRKGTSAYFVTIFIYDDKYGDPIYTASAEYTMHPSSYYSEYDVFDYYYENTFPSDSDVSESIYLQLEVAMLYWDGMVKDAIGVGLKDLGFTHYQP